MSQATINERTAYEAACRFLDRLDVAAAMADVLPEAAMREARSARHEYFAAVHRAEAAQRCRVCGCTNADCAGCYARASSVKPAGEPCSWVLWDVCSACVDQDSTQRATEGHGVTA